MATATSSPTWFAAATRWASTSTQTSFSTRYAHFDFPLQNENKKMNKSQMAGGSGTGVGGTTFDAGSKSYPGVPYSSFDFNNQNCEINYSVSI